MPRHKKPAPVKVEQAPPLPKPAQPEAVHLPFVNTTARTLHYGDGRRLLPGQSDDVAEALLAIWRGAGFIA